MLKVVKLSLNDGKVTGWQICFVEGENVYGRSMVYMNEAEAVEALARIEARNAPAAPVKPVKLSPTMQAVMDDLRKADWYYKHNGEGCPIFATESGIRPIGFERSAIVEGGYVYTRMDSKTLAALQKRGLIEVAHDGGNSIDVMKVVGMELPERLTKALLITLVATGYKGREITLQGFAVNEAAAAHVLDYWQRRYNDAAIDRVTEIELDVWDYFQKK